MKKRLFKLIVKYVNVKGLLKDLVKEELDEILEKAVQSSKTPFDNMAKASLWPVIEEELAKAIDEKIDLEKWLGIKEEKQA